MKFKATITFTYEFPDEYMERLYTTTNKYECAQYERDFRSRYSIEDITALIEKSRDMNFTVEPAE